MAFQHQCITARQGIMQELYIIFQVRLHLKYMGYFFPFCLNGCIDTVYSWVVKQNTCAFNLFLNDLLYSGDDNLKGGCHSNVPVTMASEHYEKTFWAAQRQCHQFVFQTDQKCGTKKFANKCSSVDGTAI